MIYPLSLVNFPAPSISFDIRYLLLQRMQTKKTAPFEVSNDTKQYLHPTGTISDVIAIKKNVHVRWPGQTSGAFGLALNFLYVCFRIPFFVSRQRKQREVCIGTIFLLLLFFVSKLVPIYREQRKKKERKKSTPATIYCRCRTP